MAYVVNEPISSAETLSVSLFVVPKQAIASIVSSLSDLSITISALQIKTSDASVEADVIIPLGDETNQQPESGLLNMGLIVLALVLFIMLLYQPISQFETAIDELQPALVQAKKQAGVASELKRDNKLLRERLQFVGTKLTDYPLRIAILTKLSRVLPTHTWLERSDIKGDVLTVRGESASASDLINLLTETGHFGAVHFSAPTTHNEQSGKERFQIEAKLKRDRTSDGH